MNVLLLLSLVLTALAAELLRTLRRRMGRRRLTRRRIQRIERFERFERGSAAGGRLARRGPSRWKRKVASLRAGRLAKAEWSVPMAAGIGAAAMVGGPVGLAVGALLGVAARRWLPRVRSPDARRAAHEQEQLTRQLPLTAELLAACLGSCSSPAEAAAAVAGSVGSPMSERLAAVAAELSLGASAERCWERLGADCPSLAPLARCLVCTSVSGAPPGAPLTGLAHAQRATASRAAHARVRRAGVLATAPLGLCFLPAFILIGVVPVVMGLTALFARRI